MKSEARRANAARSITVEQVVRARDEAAEVEQLVGRFAADGDAKSREVNGERTVLGDEVANARFTERAQTTPLRLGELRRERDPTRRARRDDRVALATRAGRSA